MYGESEMEYGTCGEEEKTRGDKEGVLGEGDEGRRAEGLWKDGGERKEEEVGDMRWKKGHTKGS